MFGAWQAGVWSALAGRYTPELVIGVSAGALNAYTIERGLEPVEIAGLWLSATWAESVRWQVPRSVYEGLINTAGLHEQIRALMRRGRPTSRLVVVLTRVRPLKPVLVRGPELGWEHLAASCAIPVLHGPVRLPEGIHVDGGVLSPLPLWAARELGASRIVAVDCVPRLPVLSPALGWLRRRRGGGSASGIPTLTIAPGKPLGGMRQALQWKLENVRRWLDQGAEDGARAWAAQNWQ